jgi:hypothetical protein
METYTIENASNTKTEGSLENIPSTTAGGNCGKVPPPTQPASSAR